MRNRYFVSITFVAIMACPAVLWPQSLADVARAEEERRRAIKTPAKVYTNDNLTLGREKPAPPAPPSAPPVSGADPAPKLQPAKPPAPAAEAKDEKYWRTRIQAVQQSLSRNRVFLDALQSRVNALSADFVNMDDPARRPAIQQNLSTALAELERMKQEIEKQNKEITGIQDEARRAGVRLQI